MDVRGLGAYVLTGATLVGAAPAADSREARRFTLSTTTATVDDDVTVRVANNARLPRGEIRLYLVPRGLAHAVRSRFDTRLSFIGTLPALSRARVPMRVPPLEAGTYALAYWCRACLAPRNSVGLQTSPALRVEPRVGEGCQKTRVNGKTPRGASASIGRNFHGNGELAAMLRKDGTLVTNALGGHKLIWIASAPIAAHTRFTVSYRRLDVPSQWVSAETVSGRLSGFDGPSWASRMSFEPGCWHVTGRLADLSLGFVVQVERPGG